MKKIAFGLFWSSLVAVIPLALFAEWSNDVKSIAEVREWKMDDRIVYVKGMISRLDADSGFYLADDTAEIHVHLDNKELREHNFKQGMRVEVKGRVVRDHHRADLNAHAVKFADGKIIGAYL